MGLPVQALARDVGGGVVEFPLNAGLEDDVASVDSQGADSQIEAEERDRRFAEMAERQARFMFRVAHGLLRSVQDAEDAVQEALLKLYRTDGWLRMEDEKAFLARTVWRGGVGVGGRGARRGEAPGGEGGVGCGGAAASRDRAAGG